VACRKKLEEEHRKKEADKAVRVRGGRFGLLLYYAWMDLWLWQWQGKHR
jgi:hypothetical protein